MAYDNIDTELINAMLGNGRASLRTLAEELDVSVTTVSNHLKDLEEEGVVTGYTPIIDYDRLGYDVTAVLQLNVEGSAIPDVTAHLTEIKELTSVYEVTGEFDIIAIGKFRDTDEMNARIKEILSDGDITGSSTSVVLNAAAENEQFELDVE
ncbi:Lrp/AsnC family transcriptional regulator (plasmid) [Halarchaeum sp. CBA1220]|uniref:AsnC family transcriptional regulator n=1 Tax=Halarchaeum grantii TaxID=1193105 RepID=A0A830FE80_9EURY|nr:MULTISPECIES: HTH-type transcriptional regulator Lrp [Halarchaeum]QLC34887.1 Lrp/AsnC family transcriptional regulator [Halarchaeum sp. CBA1220]GGL37942.1 AsnC family transcriptional regulator [Halarchaeum grantii]